ncbi:MAG: hypothetical protein JXB15_05265 [Anaerolineales bacterium]|nr:hypothetical protein [Anaerolineales bacterium]
MNSLPQFSEIYLPVVIALFNAFIRLLVDRVMHILHQREKKASEGEAKIGIILATDKEVRRYGAGREVSEIEKKQAIEYLKIDIPQRIRKLEEIIHQNSLETPTSQSISRMTAIASGILTGYTIYGTIFTQWSHTVFILIAGSVIVILIPIVSVLPLLLKMRQINSEVENIINEISASLFLFGSKLTIDIDSFVKIYISRDPNVSPIELNHILDSFGFHFPRDDIFRAYFFALFPTPEKQFQVLNDIFLKHPNTLKGKQFTDLSDEERSELIGYIVQYLSRDLAMNITKPKSINLFTHLI